MAVNCIKHFWQKADLAKSSTSLNAKKMCIRIGASRDIYSNPHQFVGKSISAKYCTHKI